MTKERFLVYILKTDTCWIWTGALIGNGYGQLRVGSRRIQAHRFSWELHYGTIPKGMFVLHECDNRRCVNPNHLFLGTYQDNAQDREDKGRGGKKNGKLIKEEVIEIYLSNESPSVLARKYGISRSQIAKIRNGQTWSWLTDTLRK